jgi:spore maturation protein A
MLNGIFVTVVLGSILLAACTGSMSALVGACFDSARSAVDLALGLVGTMAFFLGLVRVGSDAGLLALLARASGGCLMPPRFLRPPGDERDGRTS